jgi:phosphohistidine phosphatase
VNLYLLRHVDALDLPAGKGARDELRPLSEQGETKAWRIARAFAELDLSFDLVLASPAVRARRTAEMVLAESPSSDRVRLTENLLFGADPAAILAELKRMRPLPKDVLLVGHEPHLGQLASVLLMGQKGLALRLKRGGLAKFSADRMDGSRNASLEWWVAPRLWRSIASRKKGKRA